MTKIRITWEILNARKRLGPELRGTKSESEQE